jgi:Holliday junction resolvase RusA-like endonuclease
VIAFTVRGTPVPQGSAKPFIAGGRARLATKSAPLMAWRTAIATAAGTAMGDRPVLTGPLSVRATFHLPRPVSAPKRIVVPATRPDVDKLVRALLDGVTGVAIADDALVVQLVAGKRYGTAPGVDVTIEEWQEDPS